MDEKELLQLYHRALASGKFTLAQVNAAIKKDTGGKYKTYAELAAAAFGVQEAQEELEAAVRVSEREPGIPGLVTAAVMNKLAGGPGIPKRDTARAVGDFGTAARSGATFGFDDEIIGLVGGTDARDRARQRMADLERVVPGGTALAKIAGGVAVPLGAAGAGARTGIGLLARAGRGALAGGGAGAAAGGLLGAGEAEGGLAERGPAALRGAIGGGIAGTVLGSAAPFIARYVPRVFGRKRGQRLARDVRKTARVDRSLDEAFAEADRILDDVREELYGPLDDMFAVDGVTHAGVQEALAAPEIRLVVRSVSKDVAKGTRGPTVKELQTIRTKGRAAGKRSPEIGFAADELSDEMQLAIPGLREADQEFARAKEVIEALTVSRRFINRPATITRRAMDKYGPEGQAAFREGLIQEFAQRLESREGAAPAVVQSMLELGPEMKQRLRIGFPTDEAFEEFMLLVATEKNTLAFSRQAKFVIKWLLAGTLAGAGASEFLNR